MTLAKSILYMVVLVWSLGTMQAQSFYDRAFRTRAYIPEVKTLRCMVDANFENLPIIDLAGNQSLEISFDYLADERVWLSYRVVHCTADWQISDIPELDYIDGFQPTRLEDIEQSYNTYITYYHYRVTFPNDDVKLLLSGNYAVLFFEEDAPDDILAVATFSVSEQMAFVSGVVSANTDVDFKAQHQQLTLTTSWSESRFPNMDPAADLALKVMQNRRPDTERTIKQPTRFQPGKAFYEHIEDLIFYAGNNYRRFEVVDERYATIGVERVVYKAPYFHALLKKDAPKMNYFYDKDQHGHFFIRASRAENSDTEADYFWAYFTLQYDRKFGSMQLYLMGDLTNNMMSAESLVPYNAESGCYETKQLLKFGAYNYQYVVGDTLSGHTALTAPVEGDFYEANNEYWVGIYYRPMGARYDRLLGYGVFYYHP